MGLRRFLGLRKKKPKPLSRPVPWITDGAVAYLDRFLDEHPSTSIMEFGAGASTLYLVRRGAKVVSVEHNPEWHEAVCRALSERGDVADMRLREIPYHDEADRFPDGFFDLVLVDGRGRVACAAAARRVLRPGGVMMVDNTGRIGTPDKPGRYHELPGLFPGWHREDFVQIGPDQCGWSPRHRDPDRPPMTTVWIKPD